MEVAMKKKIFFMILVALALLSIQEGVLAQDSDKVVILSPRVGSVIDGAERERYQLFQEIRGFDRSVFLQTPKKSYYAKIMFVGPDGGRRDTTIRYSKDSLSVLAERIDHFEDLKAEKYRIGDQPAKIQLADTIRMIPYDLQEAERLRQLAERAGESGKDKAKDKVVILSPRVGSVIDAAERQRYELFPEIRGFDRAVFLQTPEKTYYAKVTYIEPDGARGDTTVQCSEDTLLVLAERIEHFEELKQNTYHIGERPAKIQVLERRFRPEVAAAPPTQGTDVVVLLTTGQEIEGELVSVRDSSVLIATEDEDVPSALSTGVKGILGIKDTMISHVTIEGNSNVLLGMGLGFLGGTVAGGVIGAKSYSPPPEPDNLGGAIAGMVEATVGLGAAVGAATSRSDIEVNLSVPAERLALKKLARYPDKEPKSFQVIK
jgi:hypothetical protein